MALQRTNNRTKAEAQKSGMKRATVQNGIQYDNQTKKYIVEFYFGKQNGKAVRKHRTFLSLQEATEAKRLFEAEKIKGLPKNIKTKMTLTECMDEFIDDSVILKRIERTTERGYRVVANRIKEQGIGRKYIGTLTVNDLENYIKSLQGNFKNVTINKDIDLIDVALKHAIKKEYISENPVLKLERPKEEQFEATPYTIEEVEKLKSLLLGGGNLPLTVAVFLGVYQGLRRGEILGLKWDNIDFENNSIYITETLTQIGGEIISKKPKTEKSQRYIGMTDTVREILTKYREHQSRRGYLCEYVMMSDTGNRYNPTHLSKTYAEFLKRYGLRQIRFHDLRHTFATLAIENNVPVNLVSGALGHSTIATTFNIYTHANKDASARVTEMMKNVF